MAPHTWRAAPLSHHGPPHLACCALVRDQHHGPPHLACCALVRDQHHALRAQQHAHDAAVARRRLPQKCEWVKQQVHRLVARRPRGKSWFAKGREVEAKESGMDVMWGGLCGFWHGSSAVGRGRGG
eukprot:356723-Chlamydomonas_euryale.AAC.3